MLSATTTSSAVSLPSISLSKTLISSNFVTNSRNLSCFSRQLFHLFNFRCYSSRRSNNNLAMTSKFSPRASAQKLSDPDELIDSVETFIFDCDGLMLIFISIFFLLINLDIIEGYLHACRCYLERR